MGSKVGAEVKTIKHTQCQIEMITKAERQSIPRCGVRCDRQVRANAGESTSVPLLPKGWDRQQQRENHFTIRRRGNWQERDLRKGGTGGWEGILRGEEFLGWRGYRYGGMLGQHLDHTHKLGLTDCKCQAANPGFWIMSQSSEVWGHLLIPMPSFIRNVNLEM